MKMKVTPSPDLNLESNKSDLLLKDGEFTKFFKSKRHELAFFFKVNNAAFDSQLGIKKIHTVDKVKANTLKSSYLRIFHPDQNINSDLDLDLDDVCSDIASTFTRVTSGKLK